jgi:hypothetical protein
MEQSREVISDTIACFVFETFPAKMVFLLLYLGPFGSSPREESLQFYTIEAGMPHRPERGKGPLLVFAGAFHCRIAMELGF